MTCFLKRKPKFCVIYLSYLEGVHCKKRVNDFPIPSRDVTNQTLPGRE